MEQSNARVKNGNTRMQQFWRLLAETYQATSAFDETACFSAYSNVKRKEYISAGIYYAGWISSLKGKLNSAFNAKLILDLSVTRFQCFASHL